LEKDKKSHNRPQQGKTESNKMKRHLILTCIAILVACSGPNTKKAIATVEPKNGSSVFGTIVFFEEKGVVKIKADISGLGEGPVAIHLHGIGDCLMMASQRGGIGTLQTKTTENGERHLFIVAILAIYK
jgi:Cu/Zn superoxide dismutase